MELHTIFGANVGLRGDMEATTRGLVLKLVETDGKGNTKIIANILFEVGEATQLLKAVPRLIERKRKEEEALALKAVIQKVSKDAGEN